MEKTNKGYDGFSTIYDKFWGDWSLAMAPLIQQMLLSRIVEGGRVMDLCCGTGQFAEVLVEKGYAVTGVDSSVGMLEVARARVPSANFVVADMEAYRMDREFDGAVCLYDSLNHVSSAEALVRVFGNVFSSLKRGGRFAFDLNTRQKYMTAWDGKFSWEDEEGRFEVVATHEEDRQIAVFRGEYRISGGEVSRVIELRQTWFSLNVVRELLKSVGLGIYAETSPKGESLEDGEKANRVVFFVKR